MRVVVVTVLLSAWLLLCTAYLACACTCFLALPSPRVNGEFPNSRLGQLGSAQCSDPVGVTS